MRPLLLCGALLAGVGTSDARAQREPPTPLPVVDVPFIAQSEALCGGAAAAMVLRYWGERDLSAEAFAHLVDWSAAGIRTDALVADLRRRGWNAHGVKGTEAGVRAELARGRPVLTLIEDRPSTFHYVVTVAWHERGVVFHDPARGPFRVMSASEFTRRWRAARSWMAIVVPGSRDPGSGIRDPEAEPGTSNTRIPDPGSPIPAPGHLVCEQALVEGVRLAQASDLAAAERTLAAALACPGALRELAGIRVLQKRWSEAADLAETAVTADPTDTYAWKVLATSRFVQDDRLGALQAWNHAGEPRVDLVRIDGLTRTRHPVVERLLAMRPGEALTPDRLIRARRRLSELPSASSGRLEYVPVGSGLAELRGAVTERPLVPAGRLSLAMTALEAAATREARLTTGSILGGGERMSAGWRFWPHRRRVDAAVQAPTSWGGIWSVEAFSDRQPFSAPEVPSAERAGARLELADWATGRLRWSVAAGVDEWAGQRMRGNVGAGVRWVSRDDRVDGATRVDTWPGRRAFSRLDLGLRARSSSDRRGVVLAATLTAQLASEATPLDLWWAGDTGHARATLLRAHPLLDAGRLRVERLGRGFAHGSLEGQRWWRVSGPVRMAAAAFTDVARTGRRFAGPPRADIDAGVGARLAVDGMRGVFRVDVARGLRDGAAAVSVGFQP